MADGGKAKEGGRRWWAGVWRKVVVTHEGVGRGSLNMGPIRLPSR